MSLRVACTVRSLASGRLSRRRVVTDLGRVNKRETLCWNTALSKTWQRPPLRQSTTSAFSTSPLCKTARSFSGTTTTTTKDATSDDKYKTREATQAASRHRLADGGLPDFVEQWSPTAFRQVGYGLAALSAVAWPLSFHHEVGHLAPLFVTGATILYWRTGLRDLASRSALRRNFPVLINVRYLLESIRPEIQQYFIEKDNESEPFSRAQRSVVYRRAKNVRDTVCLGTKRDVYAEGHEWANHSMWPLEKGETTKRVLIGGNAKNLKLPYSASLLNISAMSFGALSENAIAALNDGAKLAGCYHNTGEGGVAATHLRGADVVWNVGTGYFACGERDPATNSRFFSRDKFAATASRDEIKMIEVKLSQGAKPAHGGILPASKITPAIAEARQLTKDDLLRDVASPPRHSAFDSPDGLLRFVHLLRDLSGGKPVGIKLCVGQPVEAAALVHAMLAAPDHMPDFLTIDGAEGGTGAAPPEFQDSVGMPLAEGLRLMNALLVGAGLRDSVTLIGSGKIADGFSMAKTFALGADVCNAARAMMFALGCIQALKCNTNRCPTGITTQDPRLYRGLDVDSKALRVWNFHAATVESCAEIMAAMGARTPREVSPDHIFKRENGIHVKSLRDMHTEYFACIPEGALLEEGASAAAVPPRLRDWWQRGGDLHAKKAASSSGLRVISSDTFEVTTL